MNTTPILLCLVAAGLPAQVKPEPGAPRPSAAKVLTEAKVVRPMLDIKAPIKGDLLPAGKTQGTFHLTGLVRKDRTVVLRWANNEGEMPTEGVRVFRRKEGDDAWKDLTGRRPLGFLQGRAAEKRLKTLPREERERILAYPFGDIQFDPATRQRQAASSGPALKGLPERAEDLTPEKSLQQFRRLRAQGRLERTDLRMMHMRADMDEGMAELLGLTYTDDPGKGVFRYKIQIALPEGGMVEVECPRAFDTREATPIPQPLNLTATSGNGEVLLNWDESPSEAVAGYNIYRAESPDGPWTKPINADPVKKVELDVEDPEISLRRSLGVQEAMARMLRPLPAVARTPEKIRDAHIQALAQMETPANLPSLSARSSKSIKDAVAAGRLRGGGPQVPKSVYTDSIRAEGNALVNEKTYYYKVTALDIGGQQQPLDTAPVVAGMPKDLEPPQVPQRPHLKTEAAVLRELDEAHGRRLQDSRFRALDQAVKTRLATAVEPLTPFQLQASDPAPAGPTKSLALGHSLGSGSVPTLAEAGRLRLGHQLSTMPSDSLKKLTEAVVLRSRPDGTVPPAELAWPAVTDGDLKGYEVYRASGTGEFGKVAETATPEWADTSLQPGLAYRYAIASVDRLGNASARSPECRVEVCDSSLPGRLAVPGLAGKAGAELPASVPQRRFIRPSDRVMAGGTLKGPRATLVVKDSGPLVAAFRAPKSPVAARPVAFATTPKASKSPTFAAALDSAVDSKPSVATLAAAASSGASLPKGVQKEETLDPYLDEAKAIPLPLRHKTILRSLNPMLLPAIAPKEIHVALEWTRPVQGYPLEYVLQQAPQKTELASSPRPALDLQPSVKLFGVPDRVGGTKVQTLSATKGLSVAGGVVPKASFGPASAGLVAAAGEGLRISEVRKDTLASFQLREGPGPFTRVNEAPIGGERYVVTFPAEIAQYGGASFYFRIQAFAKEFGRTVEGPLSEPVEVRIPDLVPPPEPQPGAVDLREGAEGSRIQVALSWTQNKVKDLAGILVDRQPMSYVLVDGDIRVGTPLGPTERITREPVASNSYLDTNPPGGLMRYVLRSVDRDGNVSGFQGHLDILVPGERVPGRPSQLVASATSLTWRAAPEAEGYTVWRSFTGGSDDWECISGILPADQTSFALPEAGNLFLRVMARSTTGLHGTLSTTVVRKP